MKEGRRRRAALLLKRRGVFPGPGDPCLEVGCGVIASTLFTSILDAQVRRRIAGEIVRVLAPGGALLWHDFAVDNPRNPNVRRVTRRELAALFPSLRGPVRSVAP